jgi:hypothetical protein
MFYYPMSLFISEPKPLPPKPKPLPPKPKPKPLPPKPNYKKKLNITKWKIPNGF